MNTKFEIGTIFGHHGGTITDIETETFPNGFIRRYLIVDGESMGKIVTNESTGMEEVHGYCFGMVLAKNCYNKTDVLTPENVLQEIDASNDDIASNSEVAMAIASTIFNCDLNSHYNQAISPEDWHEMMIECDVKTHVEKIKYLVKWENWTQFISDLLSLCEMEDLIQYLPKTKKETRVHFFLIK